MAAASEVSLHTTWEVSISQPRRISREKRLVRPVDIEKPVKDDENTRLLVSQMPDHAFAKFSVLCSRSFLDGFVQTVS
jgi:hypothetical protein